MSCIVIKETPKYREYKITYKWGTATTKAKRFLCIGGPLGGQRNTHFDEGMKDYFPFNNAGSSIHSQVYIHKDCFQC
jgi:hypothetical protein